jgi:hypothetical protein
MFCRMWRIVGVLQQKKNIYISRVLKFLRVCKWGFRCHGLCLCIVGRVNTEVAKECLVLNLTGKMGQEESTWIARSWKSIQSVPPSHPLNMKFNIILLTTPWFSKSHSLRFPHQNPVSPLLCPIRATCAARLTVLDLITRMIFGEEYRAWGSLLSILLNSLVTSSLLGPNILLSTLFSKTLSLLHSPLLKELLQYVLVVCCLFSRFQVFFSVLKMNIHIKLQATTRIFCWILMCKYWLKGYAVAELVEALRGFDSRWSHWNSSVT